MPLEAEIVGPEVKLVLAQWKAMVDGLPIPAVAVAPAYGGATVGDGSPPAPASGDPLRIKPARMTVTTAPAARGVRRVRVTRRVKSAAEMKLRTVSGVQVARASADLWLQSASHT